MSGSAFVLYRHTVGLACPGLEPDLELTLAGIVTLDGFFVFQAAGASAASIRNPGKGAGAVRQGAARGVNPVGVLLSQKETVGSWGFPSDLGTKQRSQRGASASDVNAWVGMCWNLVWRP